VTFVKQLTNTKGPSLLIAGDLIAYLFSLIVTLSVRYGDIPGRTLFLNHLTSFSILFIIFIVVNFSAGLYDKQSAVIHGNIRSLLIKVQIIDALLGVVFFYFAPVAIAPKANLFIFFVVSTLLLFLWRLIMFPVVSSSKKVQAIIVGDNDDLSDLYQEINSHERYSLSFKEHVVPTESVSKTVESIAEAVRRSDASVIVVDLHNKSVELAMPFLYSLIFSGVQIVDASKLYESVYARIPLSMVGERWLVENSATALGSRRLYDNLKRLTDVVIGSFVGVLSLILYPFVYAAIKLDDGGKIFIHQERVGMNGKPIKITKFRGMTSDDQGQYGESGKTKLRVTRVGKYIRMTRIDELPQLWSIVKGEQSLIGPRPELPPLVRVYEKEIPYYNVRHLIKPGLSGWAQIYHEAHPHHAVALKATRDKLSYDLYYIKNRSFFLDLKIALQTLKAILSRQGV